MARHRQRRHLLEEARAVIQPACVSRSPFTRRVAITLEAYGSDEPAFCSTEP
jgi:hypothetical protein